MSPETRALIRTAMEADLAEGMPFAHLLQQIMTMFTECVTLACMAELRERCEEAYNKGAYDADPAVNPDNMPGPDAEFIAQALERR